MPNIGLTVDLNWRSHKATLVEKLKVTCKKRYQEALDIPLLNQVFDFCFSAYSSDAHAVDFFSLVGAPLDSVSDLRDLDHWP